MMGDYRKSDLNNEHANIIFRSNFSYTPSDNMHEYESGENMGTYIIDRFVLTQYTFHALRSNWNLSIIINKLKKLIKSSWKLCRGIFYLSL